MFREKQQWLDQDNRSPLLPYVVVYTSNYNGRDYLAAYVTSDDINYLRINHPAFRIYSREAYLALPEVPD